MLCSIPECGKPRYEREWCRSHYRRWWRHGSPFAGRSAIGEPERFLREIVLKYQGDACLIWPYAKTGAGYGNIMLGGRFHVVSRLVCEELHGPPPTDRHEAAHSCGKGQHGCVAPGHVRWKTPVENQAERRNHGTHAMGSKNPNAKLNESEVLEIKTLAQHLSRRRIAIKFGVSETLIRKIHLGELWSHVELRS